MSIKSPIPRLEYDPDADAVYVYLRDTPWDHMVIVDDYRNIDYGPDGEPNGVELLYVSKGVNLNGIPSRDLIAAFLEEQRIPIFA